MSGVGMGMFFAPVAYVVLSAVLPEEEGQASGANAAMRALGGVFGVAVLASIFSRVGGYESAATFTDGFVTAMYVAAAAVALGALAALLVPRKRDDISDERTTGETPVASREHHRATVGA